MAPKIKYLPSPNKNERPSGSKPSLIVVHGTAGTTAGDRSWIQAPRSQVSYHIHVGKNGTLVRFVLDEDRAWHAGESEWRGMPNCNDYSLGIGLAGKSHTGYTEGQYSSAGWAIARWMKTWDIPKSRIVGHYHVSPGRKTDPWYCMEWGLLFEYIDSWLPTIE